MPYHELIKARKIEVEEEELNLDDLDDRNSSSDGTPKRFKEDSVKTAGL
jgi:hypothetical protein